MADKKQLKINKRPKEDLSDDEDQKTADVEASEPRYELGYWKIQGLASSARMMLVYADVPFKNKMYEVIIKEEGTYKKEDGKYDMSDWFDVKYKLDMDFPNLPHIIDRKTGFKLTQAKSVYRYIARQFKIGVQEDPYLSIADQMVEMIGQVMGVESPLPRSSPFIVLSYGSFDGKYSTKQFDENKAKYLKELPVLLKDIEAFMLNKKFVTGYNVSYADFCLYYLCVTHSKLDDGFSKRFPNLGAFYKRFAALEGMKRWHKTEMSKLPFNNVMAKFK